MTDRIHQLLRDRDLSEEALAAVEAALSAIDSGASGATLITLDQGGVVADALPLEPPTQDRYTDAGLLGVGGMGEVRRVRDRKLLRTVAIKRLHRALQEGDGAVQRFIAEARANAALQHPNIVPVYDAGIDEHGRPWFTLREVQGTTFTEAIRTVHAASSERWEVAESELTFQRLVSHVVSVARAIHYAHGEGVLHRDLKPDNILVGDGGEVYVVDWGLASTLDAAGKPLGTPSFMAPEQAGGALGDVLSDVYALGAVLYTVLAGCPPYRGATTAAILARVRTADPPPLSACRPAPPPALVAITERAMSRDRADRFATAAALARALDDWISGTERREHARRLLATAERTEASARASEQRAQQLREHGERLLAPVKPWQPESDKAPAWLILDEAVTAEQEAGRLQLAVDSALTAALRMDPELYEAASRLALRHRQRHEAAEAERDTRTTERAERGIREHIDMLPTDHPTCVSCAAYLRGDGQLTLVSDPPGATVSLYAYERQNRRLVPVFQRDLGITPLHHVTLPMGSYLCVLSHPGRQDVRYPVHITRQHHWTGVPPGGHEPSPIWLPRNGQLGSESVFVPRGWFASGGDPDTYRSHPARRLWCDDLVIDRFPVTNTQYIAFLDDLVSKGREADALRFAPRERASSEGALGALLYGRTDTGGFCLQPDADGDVWEPEWPVFHVDWHSAHAFMAWRREQTGLPWRLPGELEWEKAARGVDGRVFPWGDVLDPSWCRMHDSSEGRPVPDVVDSFPVDESVYGVRGVAGNTRDWCADLEARVQERRVLPPEEPTDSARRTVRGGSWFDTSRNARVANRDRNPVGLRLPLNGIRGLYRPG